MNKLPPGGPPAPLFLLFLLITSGPKGCITYMSAMAVMHMFEDLSPTGVLTSDPRIVKEARPVPLLTYDEATELAFFGATVLHPSAMQPAMQHSSLDVRVKNSYNRCMVLRKTCSLDSLPSVSCPRILLRLTGFDCKRLAKGC